MNHKLKIILVLVLSFQNYIFSEEHKIKNLKALVGQEIEEIRVNLDIDSEKESLGLLVLYFKSGYQNTALAFDKEQRKVVLSYYNKFVEWKKVAIENNIKDFNKDIGIISGVYGLVQTSGSWQALNTVDIEAKIIITSSGPMLVFVVPKHNAHNNKYISVPANTIAFPENKETESIGISTPKVIFEIFKEEELQNQANEILNQLDEKKKLDELFK